MLVFVDTNIFLDLLFSRNESAELVIERAISCEFTILINELIVEELRRHASQPHVHVLLGLLSRNDKLLIEEVTPADEHRAKLLKTHYADALHASTALRMKADVFLTQNIRDFIGIEGLNVQNLKSFDFNR